MESIRKTVLVVDDNISSLTTAKNLLKARYEAYPVSSADRMFVILQKVLPDLILLDIEMPDMDGYEAIKRLKADKRSSEIPVIFLTSKSDEKSEMKGFALGAADYIQKPFSPPLLMQRIENQLLLGQQRKTIQRHAGELMEMVAQKDLEVFNLQNAIIRAIANLAELRDEYGGGHILRMQLLVEAMLDGLVSLRQYTDEISGWNLELILPSVQLYDIGKIAIPDSILNKTGPLDERETEIMKTHVTIGVDALNKIISDTAESDFLRHAVNMAGAHHEKWDGSGYPNGLSGRNIPLEARLVAIADVYDSLRQKRPGKKAYTHEEAMKIIKTGAGTYFDPVLTDICVYVGSKFYEAAL